jgi:hypothetical protein
VAPVRSSSISWDWDSPAFRLGGSWRRAGFSWFPRGRPGSRLRVAKTFRQTRSGTGNTHALGQDLPRIRTLDDGLSCCPQARLRTLPEVLGKRGKEGLQMQMRRQKRRVQVTLHWPDPTRALVPALGERLLDVGATPMTILRQFGTLGGDARPAMPPVLATVRRRIARNIPGARSPTLRPNCFCQARYEIFSVMIVSPTATIS